MLFNNSKVWLYCTLPYSIVFAGLAKFEDNLLSQINNQEAIIDTLKGRLEAKDKQARPTTQQNFIGHIPFDPARHV